jgi:hypothetical protein
MSRPILSSALALLILQKNGRIHLNSSLTVRNGDTKQKNLYITIFFAT